MFYDELEKLLKWSSKEGQTTLHGQLGEGLTGLTFTSEKYGVQFKICSYIRLINHSNHIIPSLINEIYDPVKEEYACIPLYVRKGLINKAIGETGRKQNKRHMAFTFKNEDDANMCISRAEKRGVKYELLNRFSFHTNHSSPDHLDKFEGNDDGNAMH